jgi:uncharacterized protein involved in exopolysaccharide biosynthesis
MPGSTSQNDWVFRVLSVQAPLPDDEEFESDMKENGLDVADIWQAASHAFRVATDQVDGQISALQAELRQSEDDELVEIAEFGLNGITGNTRVPLLASLMDAKTGSRQDLITAGPKIEGAAQAFLNQLASEPRVAACDENPYGVPMSIYATYSDAVQQLLTALRIARR